MKLWSSEFEDRLRARVRAEVAASPALLEGQRRAVQARWSSSSKVVTYGFAIGMSVLLLPLLVLGGPLMLLVGIPYFVGGTNLVLTIVGLTQLGGACLLAHAIEGALFKSTERATLAHLPIADAEIVRIVCRRVLPYSLISLYVVAVPYLMVAAIERLPLSGWLLAVALVGIQWLTMVATAAILVGYRPGWPNREFTGYAAILVVCGPFFMALCELKSGMLPLMLATPGGLIGAALTFGYRDGMAGAWLLLVPVALMVAAALPALRRLQACYSAGEVAWVPRGRRERDAVVAGGEGRFGIHHLLRKWTAWSSDPAPVAAAPCFRAEETERLIRARTFLARPNWTCQGWIERLAGRLLSRRERAIVDFMQGERSVEAVWRWGFLFYCVIAVVAALSPGGFGRVVLYMFFLLCASGVALFPRPCPGFRLVRGPGGFIPHYAPFPLTFRETGWALWKTSLPRASIVPPVVALAAIVGVWRLDLAVVPTAIWAVDLVLLSLTQPGWWIVLSFCDGASDPDFRRQDWRPYVAGGALVLGGIMAVSVMLAAFFFSLPAEFRGDQAPEVAGASIMALVGALVHAGCLLLFWKLVGRLHANNRIDLMPSLTALRLNWHGEFSLGLTHVDGFADLRRRYGRWRWLRQAYWIERRNLVGE